MKKGKSFLWVYYLPFLVIVLISLTAIAWYGSRTIKQLYLNRTAADLEARSRLVSKILQDKLTGKNYSLIDDICDSLGQELSTRFTLILPDGTVAGDSEENPEIMENHANRPEIKAAFQGNTGLSTRYSRTLKQEMMYVATGMYSRDKLIGVMRSSLPVTLLSHTLTRLYRRLILAGLMIVLTASLITFAFSQRIRKPINQLVRGAEKFGKGNLEHRIHVSDPREFTLLGTAMNKMAGQLSDRLKMISEQHNELEGVLSSMIEGVLLIDSDEKILRFNEAASRLFEIPSVNAKGRAIQEVIRNIHLLAFIRQTLKSKTITQQEIILHEEEERYLQAYGTILQNQQKESIGVLIVLNDITQLKKLENLRKDFVANVSHELKTPITAIKGSVETLKGGAMNNKEEARRFLSILLKHTDRLNAIIDDLLKLSRIEEVEKKEINLKMTRLKSIIEEGVSVCQNKAKEKEIIILINCSNNIKARINAPLIEEAVINLIDNAIKYSEPKSEVEIECFQEEKEIMISVKDKGRGIPKEHQSRIFERFYRIDKARSRNLGGTGLGLSIVKHIVETHRGKISVESAEGEGATFKISLPLI